MNNLFSDKVLLSLGILLLLGNGLLMWKKNSSEVSAIQDVQRLDASATAHLMRAGLLVPILNWDDSLKVHDVNNQSLFFRQLLGEKNKLILRFSELSCNVCVDSELLNLKKFVNMFGPDNVLILATYKNLRDLLVFKRINRVEFPVYNIPENVFPVEQAGGPFLFVANSRQKALMPFIPNKEIPNLSADYYQFIVPLFQHQNNKNQSGF